MPKEEIINFVVILIINMNVLSDYDVIHRDGYSLRSTNVTWPILVFCDSGEKDDESKY